MKKHVKSETNGIQCKSYGSKVCLEPEQGKPLTNHTKEPESFFGLGIGENGVPLGLWKWSACIQDNRKTLGLTAQGTRKISFDLGKAMK